MEPHHKENLALSSLLGLIILSGALLTFPKANADTTAEDIINVTVPSSCSISASGTLHIDTINSGVYKEGIGETSFGVICNDQDGFAVYAIGFTDEEYGKTVLASSLGEEHDVITGTATSGNISNWAMKLTAVSSDSTPVIASDANGSFANYHVVPNDYTKVASFDSVTGSSSIATIKTTYSAFMTIRQSAGTYEGKVKYVLVHPRNTDAPEVPTLYNAVKKMSKGKQVASDLGAPITTPTSADYDEDTSNSGVYEYDDTVFGESDDAGNQTIYYYRGILENTPDTYGSSGSAVTYPNYVKLANNTCWRIVRTTGSGGVKMIYNGIYTNNTCANYGNATQLATKEFNDSYTGAIFVGYTYNSTVALTSTFLSTDQVFGSTADPFQNDTRSTVKAYLEDEWYVNNMSAYTSLLEANAGYCNDRTIYKVTDLSAPEQTDVIPYKTSSADLYYGPRERSGVSGANPTLACPRGDVDLYRYVSTTSGEVGHEYTGNELKYPVSLLTADEANLAGSGFNGTSVYHAQSYLRSGSDFWLLSPYYRSANGYAGNFSLSSNGYFNGSYVYNELGVRPVISLSRNNVIKNGTGTATDPWVVEQ